MVPSSLKTAILNNSVAEPNNVLNFHPISNLPFISETLENVVASQLTSHLNNPNFYEQFQPGFLPQQSIETALIKINNLVMAADFGLLTILTLLHLQHFTSFLKECSEQISISYLHWSSSPRLVNPLSFRQQPV